MRKFKNNFGCEAEFDDNISQEQIEERLKWLGGKWQEIK